MSTKKTVSNVRSINAEMRKARKERLKLTVAVFLGLLIPTMTLASSYYAGLLWETYRIAAWGFIGAGLTCMTISISHLKWSIQDTTPTPDKAAWATALVIDGLIAGGEWLSTTEFGGWKPVTMVLVLWMASVCLNIHAFLNHSVKKGK